MIAREREISVIRAGVAAVVRVIQQSPINQSVVYLWESVQGRERANVSQKKWSFIGIPSCAALASFECITLLAIRQTPSKCERIDFRSNSCFCLIFGDFYSSVRNERSVLYVSVLLTHVAY